MITELLHYTCTFLGPKDLITCRQINRQYYNVVTDPYLIKQFPSSPETINDQDSCTAKRTRPLLWRKHMCCYKEVGQATMHQLCCQHSSDKVALPN